MAKNSAKANEKEPLKEVTPNISALLLYLRRENGGAPVRELRSYYSEKHGRELHEMSDGLTYALNDERQWSVILDT